MPISMSLSCRYVTQASVYESMFTGPLTDRKIARYAKQGVYAEHGVLYAAKVKAKRRVARKSRDLAKLMRTYLTD
jgi:hypothetical protein